MEFFLIRVMNNPFSGGKGHWFKGIDKKMAIDGPIRDDEIRTRWNWGGFKWEITSLADRFSFTSEKGFRASPVECQEKGGDLQFHPPGNGQGLVFLFFSDNRVSRAV